MWELNIVKYIVCLQHQQQQERIMNINNIFIAYVCDMMMMYIRKTYIQCVCFTVYNEYNLLADKFVRLLDIDM